MNKYYISETVGSKCVIRVAEGKVFSIPTDPANTDYQQYLEWVAEGNTPEPWQPDSES